MHTSLQPKTNIKLLIIWSALAVVVAYATSPPPLIFFGLGAVLGACSGFIQLRLLRELSTPLLATQTAMDVRRVLSSSATGRLYLFVFWASNALLLALSF